MKVLIYGSTGFVGRYVVKQMINKVELYLAVRNESKVKSIFGDYIKAIKLTDKIENPIFEVNPDVVINLIGILKESKDNTFEYTHYEIPKRLIDASKSVNLKKFIQMSALGADINSKSRYQKTKAMAEQYLISSGLDYVIFRPSIIFGKEQKLFEDFKKYSKIAPFFLAPCDAKVQPVNVYDVAECFEKATTTDVKNEIFELCGNKVVNYKELFEFALKYLNIKRPVIPVPKKAFLFMIPAFSLMPDPIMTLDQYYMLQEDNVCSGNYKGVKDLLGSVRDAFVF
ncbi:complex I NDUFA9 subunit family protein [Sulfurihydrogenibium subterraneum]|uniref:complex I NDUFA9 subunit family protein n=1 Tax=Sulfurihydrogenibium subterraneum TaxID=171121 RepID=UPI000491C60F|nr:complex I NDUFA9 subunit family protein [Sulfurihydrogenibium subterraneum]